MSAAARSAKIPIAGTFLDASITHQTFAAFTEETMVLFLARILGSGNNDALPSAKPREEMT